MTWARCSAVTLPSALPRGTLAEAARRADAIQAGVDVVPRHVLRGQLQLQLVPRRVGILPLEAVGLEHRRRHRRQLRWGALARGVERLAHLGQEHPVQVAQGLVALRARIRLRGEDARRRAGVGRGQVVLHVLRPHHRDRGGHAIEQVEEVAVGVQDLVRIRDLVGVIPIALPPACRRSGGRPVGGVGHLLVPVRGVHGEIAVAHLRLPGLERDEGVLVVEVIATAQAKLPGHVAAEIVGGLRRDRIAGLAEEERTWRHRAVHEGARVLQHGVADVACVVVGLDHLADAGRPGGVGGIGGGPIRPGRRILVRAGRGRPLGEELAGPWCRPAGRGRRRSSR